ncbi:efflux RND transporter periplasmic adaptor subunit [Nitrincola nitratireducens]|uniref:Multidrug resistance protein MdtN n=1 Tax=Nitrincola nitratireducens TaxID=1229521 RepID=W9V193_9GAMM|nr:HlyD family efflux transporter periplasmic adaptor subunit [Nitrincola nitratireducens]EXJ10731.1 multidrug resistance protein MdtN [Nitrincola nitratireducens]
MNRIFRYGLPLLLIVLAIISFMYLKSTRPQAPPVVNEERRWPVSTIQLELSEASPQLRLFGRLQTPALTHLMARTAGDVNAVYVQVGERVDAGQVLLELNPLDAQVALGQRQAELEDVKSQRAQRLAQYEADQRALVQERELVMLAERQLSRVRRLVEGNRVAEREAELAEQALRQQRLALLTRELAVEQHPSRLQQLDASLQQAEGQLQLAQRNFEATQVVAPETSRIISIQVAPGEYVNQSSPLLTLVVPERIEFVASLPLSTLNLIQTAYREGVALMAKAQIEGREYQFVLDRFDSQTHASGTLQAYFKIDTGDAEHLPIGRFVEAWLALPVNEPRVWIPAASLYGRDQVYRVVEQRLDPVKVHVLGEWVREGQAGFLVVADLLKEGDQVLANRLPQAMQGLAVETVERFERN